MATFHDPAIILLDFLAVVKLWHTVNGLYIWEFVTNLDYEWSVIRGRRPYLRTIWIYSLTRVATLMAVIVNMIGFDPTYPINCQVWVTFELVFAYIAVAAATLLIALRTIAIWNKDKIVVVVTIGIWVTNLFFLGHSIMQYQAFWVPAQSVCTTPNTADGSKYNILATLSTDVILLIIMLLGLIRLRLHGGSCGLLRLLWTQGIIWLLLAIIAEVPPSLLIFLNLNVPFDLMFQTPALIVVSIAATRMYRSLTNFRSSDWTIGKSIFVGPIQTNPMEVESQSHGSTMDSEGTAV